MTTSAVSSASAASLVIEVAPAAKFTKINKTDFNTRMSKIAQKISLVVSNILDSIKETFSNFKNSFSNAVSSLINRVQALFKKEEVKAAPVEKIAPALVEEVAVVSLPQAPAPWYATESLKASALSVKATVGRVFTVAKDKAVSAAHSIVDFTKEHKMGLAVAAAGVLTLGGAGYFALNTLNKYSTLIGGPVAGAI